MRKSVKSIPHVPTSCCKCGNSEPWPPADLLPGGWICRNCVGARKHDGESSYEETADSARAKAGQMLKGGAA